MRKKYDKRKQKRCMNQLAKKISVGGYFLGCNGHPCMCTNKNIWYGDIWGSDVTGISIIDGRGLSCSMLHCSPEPLSKNLAESIKDYWNDPLMCSWIYHKMKEKFKCR